MSGNIRHSNMQRGRESDTINIVLSNLILIDGRADIVERRESPYWFFTRLGSVPTVL